MTVSGPKVTRSPERGDRRATSTFARNPLLQAAIALLFYVAITAYITWPFADHPTTTLLDDERSDYIGGVVRYRELAEHLQPPFLPGSVPDLNAPDGLATSWLVELAAAPSATAQWLLAIAVGGIGGVGLFSVASFVLSAFAMYLLVRWITGHFGAAVVAGFAFGFWPYAYTYFRFPLGHAWVLVVLVWRMLAVARVPSVRNGVYAGLAAVFALWWTHYWLLIGGVLYATLAAAALFTGRRHDLRRRLVSQLAAAVLILVFVGGLVGISVSAGFADVPQRSAANFVEFSARPLMYVLPRDSFVGRWTAPILDARYAGPAIDPDSTASYSPIYLGVTTMMLALVGWVWLSREILRRRGNSLGDLRVVAGLACSAAMLVALVFSAPPVLMVAGRSIPMPGYLVAQVLPQFRFSARFAQVVMLGLCVMAAIGLREMVRGRRRLVEVAIILAALVLLAIDLRSGQYLNPYEAGVPPLYGELRRQPAGIVAEYPLGLANTQDTSPLLFQQAHRHRVFNGAPSGSASESRKAELQDVTDPRTAPVLARLGVRHVIVRRLPLEQRYDYSGVRRSLPGLRLLAEEPYGALYKVVAAPALDVVAGSSGFERPDFREGRGFSRWTNTNPAMLDVDANCARCSGSLRLRAASYSRPRQLTVKDETGRVLVRQRIPVRGTVVEIPMRFQRHTALSLTTQPAPQSTGEVADPGDLGMRGVEIRRLPLRVTGAPKPP